jgi:16S rRNA (guanine527-N7)-methyltransferase
VISKDTDISGVCAHFNVSRETSERLQQYLSLLLKWNQKINLVSKSTIEHAAVRHFADSIQLWNLRPDFGSWADIGSGAGFPGMVLAILASETEEAPKFHLVESDARKCAFLRNVSRETNVPVKVHTNRVEDIHDLKVDVVSARALAPVAQLLAYSENLIHDSSIGLYLKGQNCDNELEEASRSWTFEAEKFASETDENGTVLRIRNIHRVR